MKEFYDYLYKYGLHDCIVNNISYDDGKLYFNFNSGIYELNELGQEDILTPSVIMAVEIENISRRKIWQYVEINKVSKKKYNEVEFDDFVENIKENKFDICINYYSYFNNTILLNGYINEDRYEIIISNTKGIKYIFS